jgi:serine/threonine protein kinase
MSANPVIPFNQNAEPFEESLTGRMGRGRLPIAEALGYATQIAACLRDLHTQGLVYGALNSQSIVLGPAGASLRSSGSFAHLGDARADVTAFGLVLSEMLRKVDGPDAWCAELNALAVRCQDDAPGMRQVLMVLRLLRLRVRQGAVKVLRPILVPRPEPVPRGKRVWARLHLSLHWKPLVHVVASVLGR